MTGEFPTRCESIIAKRDPIFFKGMKAFFEEGKTAAFVGVGHIPGIQEAVSRRRIPDHSGRVMITAAQQNTSRSTPTYQSIFPIT